MKTIVIRPLTSELNADYLDFFDHRAFTDGNPNGPCYCTSPNQEEEQIEKMVSEFKIHGVKETLRRYAAEMLDRTKSRQYKCPMTIERLVMGRMALGRYTIVTFCLSVLPPPHRCYLSPCPVTSTTTLLPQSAKVLPWPKR